MRIIIYSIINFLIFQMSVFGQSIEEYRACLNEFYDLAFEEQVSVKDFSSVYANASIDYEASIYLLDSLGYTPKEYEIQKKVENRISVEAPSIVHTRIRNYLRDLTEGKTKTEIVELIKKSEYVYNDDPFTILLELDLSKNKSIFYELTSDAPVQVCNVWLENGASLDDIIREKAAPEKLWIKGIINDPDGYVNIRKGESIKSSVVGKIVKEEVFLFIPNYCKNWWKVKSSDGSVEGYMHKSRIIPLRELSKE